MNSLSINADRSTVSFKARGMLIGGEWVPAVSGASITVENPARRKPIGQVPRGRTEDVERAVAAAADAFPGWAKIPARDRGRQLMRIGEALEVRSEEIARTIASETGNALRTQARGEARMVADAFRYFGGLAGELKGLTVPLGEGMLSYTRREPIGVVGAIVPWNAPAQLAALKIAPAICAGNTIVLKAAEDAPLAVLMIAEICQDHLPPGVVNVVTGYGEESGAPLPLIRLCARSASLGPPQWDAPSCALRPSGLRQSRWSSAGKARQSSTKMPMRTGWSTALSPRCASPGKASPVPPARVYSFMPESLTSSSTNWWPACPLSKSATR